MFKRSKENLCEHGEQTFCTVIKLIESHINMNNSLHSCFGPEDLRFKLNEFLRSLKKKKKKVGIKQTDDIIIYG